jgi:hypothetical protein
MLSRCASAVKRFIRGEPELGGTARTGVNPRTSTNHQKNQAIALAAPRNL